MPIKYQKFIYREDVQANPDQIYVFGDNMFRKGLGGQAKHMRGEPNTIGVVTKRRGGMDENDFFNDTDPRFRQAVIEDLVKVQEALLAGKTVVVPRDGIGTGLSQLPDRAPMLNASIVAIWNMFERDFGIAT